MNKPDENGNLVFCCDFCGSAWDDQRPMVEGHRGSLICGNCLSIAFMELVHLDTGITPAREMACVLCLENGRDGLHWVSPMNDEVIACRRCIKQSAGVLHKDPDIEWKKPPDPRHDG
tara:strand:+ start:14 stop:364 length:351 start_codon:yes stop_codon:yes gene_type:complete